CNSFFYWMGRFHLLVLHFPIALVLAAAVAEFGSVVRRSRVPLPAIRFCLLLATTSVVTTVALGWLHALAGNGAGMPRILAVHRWLGTAAGVGVTVATALCEWDARRGVRSLPGRVLLFVAALLVGLTGHAQFWSLTGEAAKATRGVAPNWRNRASSTILGVGGLGQPFMAMPPWECGHAVTRRPQRRRDRACHPFMRRGDAKHVRRVSFFLEFVAGHGGVKPGTDIAPRPVGRRWGNVQARGGLLQGQAGEEA